MRQIKFRAWHESAKIMLNPFGLADENTNIKLLVEENWPIMQFTGLLDKNGKEIYEGDIVLSKYKYNDTYLENTDKVVWDEESCSFKLSPRSFHYSLILEVIGNIYKNPELLKSDL